MVRWNDSGIELPTFAAKVCAAAAAGFAARTAAFRAPEGLHEGPRADRQ